MGYFTGMSELELVEALANYESSFNDIVTSEEDLSNRFDSMIEECFDCCTKLKLKEDEPMLSEEFSNFADSLISDGILHPAQCNVYDYIGEYS